MTRAVFLVASLLLLGSLGGCTCTVDKRGTDRSASTPPTSGPASLVSAYVGRAAEAQRQVAARVAAAKRAIDEVERGNRGEPTAGSRSGFAMRKSCGRCGKGVSSSAKVGDRCPHCGVVWGAERRSHGAMPRR